MTLRLTRLAYASATFVVTNLLFSACSSDDGPNNPTGGAPSSGGATGASQGGKSNGGSSSAGTSSASGGQSSGGSGSGGTTASSSGGSSSGGATAAGGAGTSGGATGTASGGGSAGGSTGNGGSPGGGMTGAGGSTSTAGSTGSSTCPAEATFCSGFEDNALPAKAVFKLNGDPATPWTAYFEIDTTTHNSGKSSLRVKSLTEAPGMYKMLSVPAPGAAFWVRFYIRSDVELGASDHNAYASGSGSDDPNDSTSIEFAEDVGLAFNSHDAVRWPEGFGRTTSGGTKPFTLPKDMWHCIEISYDGAGKVQQLFIAGMQQINATNFPDTAQALKVFKFGYNAFHGTVRKIWYDDMVVSSKRVNCL